MKRTFASLLLLFVVTPVPADDSLFIIREYRVHCRSRVTEIIKIPRIEPIVIMPPGFPPRVTEPILVIDKHHNRGDYCNWLK